MTAGPIDCTGLEDVQVTFRRWLGAEHSDYDHAYLRLSVNGTDWTPVWENDLGISDSEWVFQQFDISAIADNKDFHRGLTNLGCRIIGTAEFADHHVYSPGEIEDITRRAEAGGAELLVTTQKDLSKLSKESPWPLPLVVIGVLPSFAGEENDFDAFLKGAVLKVRRMQKDGS